MPKGSRSGWNRSRQGNHGDDRDGRGDRGDRVPQAVLPLDQDQQGEDAEQGRDPAQFDDAPLGALGPEQGAGGGPEEQRPDDREEIRPAVVTRAAGRTPIRIPSSTAHQTMIPTWLLANEVVAAGGERQVQDEQERNPESGCGPEGTR